MVGMISDEAKVVLAHWSDLHDGPYVPLNRKVSPHSLKAVLPKVFKLGLEKGDWEFRLAGSEYYDVYGSELRGMPFSALWQDGYEALRSAMQDAGNRGLPIVVGSSAASAEGCIGVETLLLPLRSCDDFSDVDRFLGIQSFVSKDAWWLGTKPLIGNSVAYIKLIGAEGRKALSVIRGREVPPLVVSDVGRLLRVYESDGIE